MMFEWFNLIWFVHRALRGDGGAHPLCDNLIIFYGSFFANAQSRAVA